MFECRTIQKRRGGKLANSPFKAGDFGKACSFCKPLSRISYCWKALLSQNQRYTTPIAHKACLNSKG